MSLDLELDHGAILPGHLQVDVVVLRLHSLLGLLLGHGCARRAAGRQAAPGERLTLLAHRSPLSHCFNLHFPVDMLGAGFPGGSDGKASACNAGDLGLIPGSGRSPREGNGNLLQYSCLENSMDGGAW